MSAVFKLHPGDCIATMRGMADASIDAIVTDPPYHLTTGKKGGSGEASVNLESPYGRSRIGTGFMGMKWDGGDIAQSVEMWTEALRVLKPGGHLLAFSGSRTYHRMVCAIEDAGFEIRDQIMWVYGSGFPKSLDVSKAVDKRGGNTGLTAEIGAAIKAARFARNMTAGECDQLFCGGSTNWSWFEGRVAGQRAPTPETFARIVAHWPELAAYAEAFAEADREVTGQTTKARSTSGASALPTVGGQTVYQTWNETAPATDAARQWEGWGTALKPAHEPIVVARKPLAKGCTVAANVLAHGTGALNIDGCRVESSDTPIPFSKPTQAEGWRLNKRETDWKPSDIGRWPANLIHDGSDEVLAAFPQAPGQLAKASTADTQRAGQNVYGVMARGSNGAEPRIDAGSAARFFYCAKASKADREDGNVHPTVKPTELMAYLVRLVTPPGGTVLDPFTGSGSTGKACMREGFNFVGCELSPEYLAIAKARIEQEQLQAAIRAYDAMLKAA